jgi:hypothetical protein
MTVIQSAPALHTTARERRCRRAANSDEFAPPQLMALHLVPYQPTDTELAGISQRVYPGPFQNRCSLRRTS